MLTNLEWLAEGKPWPPPSEAKRIKQYKVHERLFMSEHNDVWSADFKKIAEKYKKKKWDVKTVLNYHQLISKKTADFVCGKAPTLETEGHTDELMKLLEEQEFFVKLYEDVIDISRYGNGLIKFVGKGVSACNPQCWVPIVDPTDIKHAVSDVIIYLSDTDADGKPRELYAEIHTPGYIEIRRHNFDADTATIGSLKVPAKKKPTGLKISAVQRLTNLTTSSSLYGLDDYNIFNSIISELMWRLYCAGTILDKHSEPSMTGPSSALTYDEKFGVYYLDLANYFRRDNKDDPPVGYITWDGNLDANFKEIERLLDQLYILTEMGQVFADAGGQANDASGTALKLRMVSPRVKAQRLVSLNHSKVKQIIQTLAELNGIDIEYKTLKIYWNDGLPVDEAEQINMLTTATGSKAVMSQYSAIKKRGLSDKDAQIELETIQKDEAAIAASVPMLEIPRDVNLPDDNTGGENE